MPVNLEAVLDKNIADLKKELSHTSAKFAALMNEIERYEKVREILFQDGRGQQAAKKIKPPKKGLTDWNAVLKKLPDTFTSEAFRKASGRNRSAVYPRQVLARWAKQHRIKRVARGKYKKI